MLAPRFRVIHYNRRTGVKTDISQDVVDCNFNINIIDSNQTYQANTGKITINNPEVILDNGTRYFQYTDNPKMFEVEDRILIFVWNSPETTEDYPAIDTREPENIDDKFGFDGVVTEVKYTVAQNSRTWSLAINDTSQVLLRNFVPCAYQQKDEYNTSPAIIRDIIKFVNNIHQVSTEALIYWAPDNDIPYWRDGGTSVIGGTGVYKTMKDTSKSWDTDQWLGHHVVDSSGDLWGILSNTSNTLTLRSQKAEPTGGSYYIVDYRNFKEVNIFGDYKPACQFVQVLSSIEYINDPNNPAGIKNPFYFYIRPDYVGGEDNVRNYFVWKQMSKEATEEIISGLKEGVDFESFDATHGAYDAINAIIINAGHSPTGHSIHTYKMDIDSVGKIEGKWKYMNTKDGDELMANEKNNNYASFDQDSNDPYPIDSAFTTSGTMGTGYVSFFRAQVQDTASSPPFILNEPVLIQSRTEYTRAIRKQAKAKAKLLANQQMQSTRLPRWKVNAQLVYGTTKIRVGQAINIQSRTMNWLDELQTTKKLRVKTIKHNINRNGWETDLELDEDWETITQTETVVV